MSRTRRGVRGVVAAFLALELVGMPCPYAMAQGASSDDVVLQAQAGDFAQIRLAGANRYETMARIVEQGYGSSVTDWAVVVTGEDFPDALMAAGLAGSKHAPIVLTQQGSLSSDARAQLVRMNTKRVYLVEDADSLSDTVRSDIEDLGISVHGISASDRYATAVEVLHEIRSAGSKTDVVIVASGSQYADALSIGPWAHATATPIMLANPDGTLPASAVSAVRDDGAIHRVVIVGGTQAVSDDVLAQLGDGFEYERLGGADRYETSARIAEWETTHGLAWKTVALATGNHFADALAGSALMGNPPMGDYHGPILLVDSGEDATVRLLKEKADQVALEFVLGGTSAVSDALADPALYRSAAKVDAATTTASQTQETPVATTTATTGTTPASLGTNEDGVEIPARDAVTTYTVVTTTEKFHLPSCGHLDRANETNMSVVSDTYDNLVAKGYSPCEHCTVPNAS